MLVKAFKKQVRIINTCTDPPPGLVWQIRRSLHWIEDVHLHDVAYIQVTDELPEVGTTDETAGWAKRARAERTHAFVGGWYAFGSRDCPPYIMLYARQIYRGIPRCLWWTTLPTLRIVKSLAHEIGHHLAATRGYVIQPGE